MRKTFQFACVAMLVLFTTSAWADALSRSREVFVEMANDARWAGYDDAVFNTQEDPGTYDDYYWIEAAGGGLNQLHITNNTGSQYGQDSTVYAEGGSVSDGEFWITTTSSKLYNDDIILMISVKPDQGQLPSNLSINIKAAGYEFDPGDFEFVEYDAETIDVTVTASDFTTYGYGLHTYKPGPNDGDDNDVWVLPLYTGQTDFTNGEQLIFIDLKAGNLKDALKIDGGAVKVTYSISGLTTAASFNALAWCAYATQGQGINWANDTVSASGTSSLRVEYVAP